MKLKLHIDKSHQGIVVLEQEPAERMLNIAGSKLKRVFMPYTNFVISYSKQKKEFGYGGIFQCGLIVLMSDKSLESTDSIVVPALTDLGRKGLVCTDHRFDDLQLKKLSVLCNTVIGMWYALPHQGSAFWSNAQKHNAKNVCSRFSEFMPQAILTQNGYCPCESCEAQRKTLNIPLPSSVSVLRTFQQSCQEAAGYYFGSRKDAIQRLPISLIQSKTPMTDIKIDMSDLDTL